MIKPGTPERNHRNETTGTTGTTETSNRNHWNDRNKNRNHRNDRNKIKNNFFENSNNFVINQVINKMNKRPVKNRLANIKNYKYIVTCNLLDVT